MCIPDHKAFLQASNVCQHFHKTQCHFAVAPLTSRVVGPAFLLAVCHAASVKIFSCFLSVQNIHPTKGINEQLQ